MTSWASACKTTLKPIGTVYKQALQILDKKPKTHPHCIILKKHNILSWENMIKLADFTLVYKILHGLRLSQSMEFVKKKKKKKSKQIYKSTLQRGL